MAAQGPPAGKHDAQALIATHAAVTQGGSAADAAIIARVESQIKDHSLMGWLAKMTGEVDSKHSSESAAVQEKAHEQQQLIADHAKDAPKNAGPPPAAGHAVVPHVTAPTTATTGGAAPHPAASAGPAVQHAPIAAAPITRAAPAAVAKPPSIAAAIAGAQSDPQLDGILNAYQPKGQQATATLGRIKQMGDIAQGFNGQLDVYVAKGGAVEHGIAAAANWLGVGKDTGAIWANNPYRGVAGILGGIMTGLSAVKSVCSVVGSICGKVGLILTVVGLLGMIFPPIGVAIEGIARILNVIGIICSAIAFVIAGILTGLNGVVLAKQIAAGASAEEKAATADLMMSEANDAAGGIINMAMIFGPKFMKGLLGNSKGVIASLFRRARASIGKIANKVTGDIKLFANKIVRRLGFGGSTFTRVEGEWKDMSLIGRTTDKIKGSWIGRQYAGAPGHIEAIQNKLMAKYGTSTAAKTLDRIGAWSGSAANRFDLEAKVGNWGESAGKNVGSWGEKTALGERWATAADTAEADTRRAVMNSEARDAAHLEETRWRNYSKQQRLTDPENKSTRSIDDKHAVAEGERVRAEANTAFEKDEQRRAMKDRLEQMRHDRFTRKNDEYYDNATNGFSGSNARDDIMDSVHGTRGKRFALETKYKPEISERTTLLAKTTRTDAENERLTALNSELKRYDDARSLNRAYENELSGMAAGSERTRAADYENWGDVTRNTVDSVDPMLEMLHWKGQKSAWESSENYSLGRPLKWDKGGAAGGAAARGGHGTYADIATDERRQREASFTAFVSKGAHSMSVAQTARTMLAGIKKPPAKPAAAGAVATAATAALPAVQSAALPTNAPTSPAAGQAPPVASNAPGAGGAPAHPGEPTGPDAAIANAPHENAGAHGGPANAHGGADVADAGGEPLPYWPALLPQFDEAAHEFGYMRNVAVEFKKAQIDGKQKAADTLAVYGKYKEYAAARQAAAKKNQDESKATSADAQSNVSHAGESQNQAGQGADKQEQAKSTSQDRAAVNLPEPETRGFWGRIFGAVKRWAKNKAAQIFGWIQEKIASVVLRGLCGVSMADMREYAGALRRQQQAVHGVADGAAGTSAQAEQTAVKLGANAGKEAQGAADALGECDRNIHDADQFMTDLASFEQQLAEEKAYAQTFIASIHAAAHAQQTQQAAEHAAQAGQHAADASRSATLASGPSSAPGPSPAPAPANGPAGGPDGAAAPGADVAPAGGPDTSHDTGDVTSQVHSAAEYVASSADQMATILASRSQDYQNELAVALTNRTGKSKDGTDLKGPSKVAAKHIVDDFKAHVETTKHDLRGFNSMSIDPASASRVADAIIQSAEHLDATYAESQRALDDLFARTYQSIKDGKHTLTDRVLNGDNVIGRVNTGANNLTDDGYNAAAPAMNTAWNTVSAPINEG